MTTPEATIIFTCRHCSQQIEVESKAVGMKCSCPACEGEITIPLRSEKQAEAHKTSMEKFYHVMEDFHQEVLEFEGSGLDLNSKLLTNTKVRVHKTLEELVDVSKQVCREMDARGFTLDMSVDWPPKVSVSFKFENAEETGF